MNFLAVFLIIILVIITVKTYKSIVATGAAIAVMFALTTAAPLYGLHQYSLDPSWSLIGTSITSSVYLHFIAFWYITDICCSAVVIKSYRNYKKINGHS